MLMNTAAFAAKNIGAYMEQGMEIAYLLVGLVTGFALGAFFMFGRNARKPESPSAESPSK
jgi:hypothetical protein